jgi:hypothetical protein
MFNILSPQRNANQNNFESSTSHQSEWLRSKSQVTADAGEDMEKEEHSSIVGGIVNWYNHSGYQSGGSSENWTQYRLRTQLYNSLIILDEDMPHTL